MTNCLVLGGANNVFFDVERALRLGEFGGVVTVNDVTTKWQGPITACVSLHGDKWPLWLKDRRRNCLSAPQRVFSHKAQRQWAKPLELELTTDYAEHMFPGQKDSGSSGLFGVKVALDELGFNKVVCCGIPMTSEARHFFNERPWGGAANHRRGWTQVLTCLQGRVKSMSGWTAEQLGKPTEAWLSEGERYGKKESSRLIEQGSERQECA